MACLQEVDWKRLVEIAGEYYRPGRFTTFAAYEWTSTPNTANLHRNIFFLDTKKVPEIPFSSIDSDDPRELWKWMDGQRQAGNELIAISHNSNLSNGLMFPTEVDDRGRPIDKVGADADAQRAADGTQTGQGPIGDNTGAFTQ